MRNNWFITSLLSGITGGVITFIFVQNWKISLIVGIVVLLLVQISNPKRRYMKAFYVVISTTLLSNIFLAFNLRTEDFAISGVLKELDITTLIVTCVISIVCLILDYLERNGNLGSISTEKNSNKAKASGNNNTILQSINKKDSYKND